jgi:uncharacterized protein (DUF2147 family)
VVLFSTQAIAVPMTGFYQTIDDETKKPKSIVSLYECEDKLCGKIVALYDAEGAKITETEKNPVRVADKVEGSPKMVGLRMIWDMKYDDGEYRGGKIMDPKSGKVYSSVIWQDKNDPELLNVRGKIGPFGRTQVWKVMEKSELPK